MIIVLLMKKNTENNHYKLHSNKIKKKSACKNFKSCIYNIQILVSETILATTILPLWLFKFSEK